MHGKQEAEQRDCDASYSIVYDDDLDSWSVVSTPFDGLYFLGSKPECEAFVTTMGISGLRLLQRI